MKYQNDCILTNNLGSCETEHKGIIKPTVLHNSPVPEFFFYEWILAWILSDVLIRGTTQIVVQYKQLELLECLYFDENSILFSCRGDLFYHLKIMYMYVGMPVCVPTPTETRDTRAPLVTVIGKCEMPDPGSGYQTPGLCKSGICLYLLSQLSSPGIFP